MQFDFGFASVETPPRRVASRAKHAPRPAAQQFEFPGFDHLQQHSFYFAVVLDGSIAAIVDQVRRGIAERSGFEGVLDDPMHLHVALLCLCRRSGKPLSIELEQAAVEAARSVRMSPFEVTLDRAMSFGKPGEQTSGRRPVVLKAHGGEALRALHERLHGGLERARIVGGRPYAFMPHVTLFQHAASVEEVVPCIRWDVREFRLIHSLHGKSQHRVVASFPLRT